MVGVEISRIRDGFLVSDAGGAAREAELMGADRVFPRLANEAAQRYGVRFDHHMFFDLDVPDAHLVPAVIAISNAAKAAVDTSAMQLSSVDQIDLRAVLWTRLERIYRPGSVTKRRKVRGSTEDWEFDAAVEVGGQLSLFEIVSPNANAVNSAVTKFLDVRDLGDAAPHRVAVLPQRSRTPHLALLARNARIISADDPDDVFLRAA
ncbi:MAG: hypothetical protein K2X45_20735 [Phreatobacter sp.]|nr:hypothetical protein [Phreatobacter sp.]